MRGCPVCHTRYPRTFAFCPTDGAALTPVAASRYVAAGAEVLRFCPCCGGTSIDATSHGSPGTGQCNDCGALFSVLASRAV